MDAINKTFDYDGDASESMEKSFFMHAVTLSINGQSNQTETLLKQRASYCLIIIKQIELLAQCRECYCLVEEDTLFLFLQLLVNQTDNSSLHSS
jgi:hypothetical protein